VNSLIKHFWQLTAVWCEIGFCSEPGIVLCRSVLSKIYVFTPLNAKYFKIKTQVHSSGIYWAYATVILFIWARIVAIFLKNQFDANWAWLLARQLLDASSQLLVRSRDLTNAKSWWLNLIWQKLQFGLGVFSLSSRFFIKFTTKPGSSCKITIWDYVWMFGGHPHYIFVGKCI
jgi:hypothetical protein